MGVANFVGWVTFDLDPMSRSPGCEGHEHVVGRLSPKNEHRFKPNLVYGYNWSISRKHQILGDLPIGKQNGAAGESNGGQKKLGIYGQVIQQIERHHEENPVM